MFGSVARGDDAASSDIDLLVDLDHDVRLVALAGLERELADLLGARVDVIPADSLRPELRDQVLSEAIVL